MKKLNRLGYFATFFTALYALFKYVQLPAAAWLMLLAGIMLAIYLPLLVLNKLKNKMDGKLPLVYKFGGVLLAMFILSVVFKFNLWGFYVYPFFDGTEVHIFSLPPISLNISYYLFSFIFIPWLIYTDYKNNKKGLFKNIIGGLGLSIISLSLIGAQLYDYYSSHDATFIIPIIPYKKLFIIGNILFVLIFLPWHIRSLKEKHDEIHSVFLILIFGYILILFIYGIFLKWDVSWHEVLMNMNSK
jgi:hypothetical protein